MESSIGPRRRRVLKGLTAGLTIASVGELAPRAAHAAEPFRVGVILPMSGPFASTGREVGDAIKLYVERNGDNVAGRKIELIVRDDTGLAPEITKRFAQELVVQDHVGALVGFGLTPLALAAAPVATEAKVPMIVMAAATSVIPQKSPFIVRTGFTLSQVTLPLADWAAKNGIRKVVTLVTDYGPGLDAEKTFVGRFTAAGGVVAESIRAPLRNPDYAPFLQRAKDAKPDALFVFVPSGEGTGVLKQFVDRGLKESGIRLICTGDVLDDDLLESIGPSALGIVSSHHYSAAHDSTDNKAFVAAFMKKYGGNRPNFHAVGGYDGMHLLYTALKKTNGESDGERLVAAMKGQSWTSPRGPMTIDATTRDVVQTVYLRRVERVDGKLWNVEFDKAENVRDPG
jgi:branched-chain amino acid transport system substrate-binding protein